VEVVKKNTQGDYIVSKLTAIFSAIILFISIIGAVASPIIWKTTIERDVESNKVTISNNTVAIKDNTESINLIGKTMVEDKGEVQGDLNEIKINLKTFMLSQGVPYVEK